MTINNLKDFIGKVVYVKYTESSLRVLNATGGKTYPVDGKRTQYMFLTEDFYLKYRDLLMDTVGVVGHYGWSVNFCDTYLACSEALLDYTNNALNYVSMDLILKDVLEKSEDITTAILFEQSRIEMDILFYADRLLSGLKIDE